MPWCDSSTRGCGPPAGSETEDEALNIGTLALSNMRLASPLWLLALALLPIAVWLRQRAHVPVWLVPFAAAWHRPSVFSASRWPVAFVLCGLALVVGALARPQKTENKRETRSRGYDIVLCIDLSSSMLSEDYEKAGERMNRLQAIRPVIQAFIEQRPTDRIGVVLWPSSSRASRSA